MLAWFIRRQIAAFGARYDYDVDYLHEVADIDLGAAIACSRLGGISSYRKSIQTELGACLPGPEVRPGARGQACQWVHVGAPDVAPVRGPAAGATGPAS